MRIALIVLVSVVLAARPLPAEAQGLALDYTGNELMKDCVAFTKAGPDDDQEVVQAARCLGFMQGLVAGVTMLDFVRNGKIDGNTPHLVGAFCSPEFATLQQQLDVVLKFMKEHPEKRHEPAVTLVLWALGQSFPCK